MSVDSLSEVHLTSLGLNFGQRALKRGFDVVGAIGALALLWPVIVIGWIVARRDTGASGMFMQERIGRNGRPFRVIKLRTMRPSAIGSTVTVAGDARITPWGARLRRWKVDELPQLWNVLVGEMSFVGPRPDVPGYLDRLSGGDRVLLTLRPGMTGPATLAYRDEEALLAAQHDPQCYNDEVIWPDKVRINRHYVETWSLIGDLRCLIRTVKR